MIKINAYSWDHLKAQLADAYRNICKLQNENQELKRQLNNVHEQLEQSELEAEDYFNEMCALAEENTDLHADNMYLHKRLEELEKEKDDNEELALELLLEKAARRFIYTDTDSVKTEARKEQLNKVYGIKIDIGHNEYQE